MKQGDKLKLSAEDQESRAGNLHYLAARYGTIAEFPENLVIKRTDDVVVLRDGTRVTNQLLDERLAEAMKDHDFADEVAEIRNSKSANKQGASKDDKGANKQGASKDDKGAQTQK